MFRFVTARVIALAGAAQLEFAEHCGHHEGSVTGGASLSETEPIVVPLARKAGGDLSPPEAGLRRGDISFDRQELSQILNVYGRKVASGEWRDYAIDTLKEKAVFSVFRRSSEIPLYRIEKAPRLARRQGAYSVIAATGLILKRGHDLARVLRALDKGLRLVEA
jgi:uncharacterized protein DUF2794